MIGRENSEDRFEQEWRDAFEGAKQSPPEGVWGGIDRELAYNELALYKSRAFYYRWVAAAVVLISISLGAFEYYYFQTERKMMAIRYDAIGDENSIVIDAPEMQDQSWTYLQVPEADKKESIFRSRSSSIVPLHDAELVNSVGRSELLVKDYNESLKGQALVAVDEEEQTFISLENDHLEEVVIIDGTVRFEEKHIAFLGPDTDLPESTIDKTLYRLPFYSDFKGTQSKEGRKYWTGVNLGSGSFNPNYQSASTTLLSENLNTNSNSFSSVSDEALSPTSPDVREGMSAGETVSLGVNFGVKLSDRWVLESGFQYARSNANTRTNLVIEPSALQEVIPATNQGKEVRQYASLVASEEVIEYQYRDVSMKNQFEFAAVPVKAGYLVLDKKISVELNAGLITNIYLGNKLTDSDDDVADLTIGPGSSSPYKSVSFSGLAGIEFGYRFMKNFDLVVEPTYQRSLNSLTKDNTDFTASPSSLGLMTGIRYIFK